MDEKRDHEHDDAASSSSSIRKISGIGIESGTESRNENGTRIRIESGAGSDIENGTRVENECGDEIRIKNEGYRLTRLRNGRSHAALAQRRPAMKATARGEDHVMGVSLDQCPSRGSPALRKRRSGLRPLPDRLI
ncbi:hypothetical protein EVAR_21376_1 [Eumeta japonica]|uniref:Uncharacterized protein n=1 Tax=Eumeta variegata TaxID=151549 RepID=A0A4C1YEE7_EUMVA|nr:hypothetical protein EVAR_21376_1 [Eumeta japonica]